MQTNKQKYDRKMYHKRNFQPSMKLFNNQTYLVSGSILYCVGFHEMSIFQRKPLPRVILSNYHVFKWK